VPISLSYTTHRQRATSACKGLGLSTSVNTPIVRIGCSGCVVGGSQGSTRRGCGAARRVIRNAEFSGSAVPVFPGGVAWPFWPFSLSFFASGAGFSPSWVGASVW
jgi:hypothetical protein